MAIPKDDDSGYTMEIIIVEYEWSPPHCGICKNFGHSSCEYPKYVHEVASHDNKEAAKDSSNVVNMDEEFTTVKN